MPSSLYARPAVPTSAYARPSMPSAYARPSMKEQLAIAFPYEPRYTLDNFVVDANEELVARLRAWHDDATTPVVWLHGSHRSGRSHLLQAICASFAQLAFRTAYVPSQFAAGAP